MKEDEKIRQPELKTEELLRLLKDIKWEYGSIFNFNGIPFQIIITNVDELADDKTGEKYGEPAEFYESTEVPGGFDIYLHDTIPESERERILFHEIMEANLTSQGIKDSERHDITLQEEEKVFGKRDNQEKK